MKRLSDQTNALVTQLYAARGLPSWLKGGAAKERVRLIAQIAEQKELLAVISLLDLLFDSATVAAAAAVGIHSLLSAASPTELLDLDEQLRRQWEWGFPKEWIQLKPRSVASLPKTEESRLSVIAVATFHPSGFVREEAIRLLADSRDGSELPYLLIRLNDWVVNVRMAASAVVEQRLHEGPLTPFVRNLGLVLRLAECGRISHVDFVRRVVRRLIDLKHTDDLLEVIRRGERRVARQCFQHALAMPGPHQPQLIQEGLRATDVVLRLWSAQHVLATETGNELAKTLAVLERDSFMPVRREALATHLKAYPETAVQVLREALLDPNPSIREFSRFYLEKHGMSQKDSAAHYHSAVTAKDRLDAALAGLGETGTEEDAALVVPFLMSADRKIRRTAVRATGRLAGDKHIDLLLGCLTDDSPKVSREAEQSLQRQAGSLDPERLWSIFAGDHRTFVRLSVLALLDSTGTWKKLPFLIRAASEKDRNVALTAEKYIERRYNRVFTKPTAEEHEGIQSALNSCADRLDPKFRKGLRCLLGW